MPTVSVWGIESSRSTCRLPLHVHVRARAVPGVGRAPVLVRLPLDSGVLNGSVPAGHIGSQHSPREQWCADERPAAAERTLPEFGHRGRNSDGAPGLATIDRFIADPREATFGVQPCRSVRGGPAVQHGPTTTPSDHTRKNDHATVSWWARVGPAIRNRDPIVGLWWAFDPAVGPPWTTATRRRPVVGQKSSKI
jgi:hypothetical protein